MAILATAVALGGALAHALEFPNKIGMTRGDYFTAQRLYDGWNLLAIVLALQLSGIIAVIGLHLDERRVLLFAVLALISLAGAQSVFWIWTHPANIATSNWTQQPDNWDVLRSQWEYSHLAGATFQSISMIAMIVAVLNRPISDGPVVNRPSVQKPDQTFRPF